MNGEAWTILIARLQEEGRPIADRLRLLASVQEQLASEVADVLRIAADGIEEDEEDEEDEESSEQQ